MGCLQTSGGEQRPRHQRSTPIGPAPASAHIARSSRRTSPRRGAARCHGCRQTAQMCASAMPAVAASPSAPAPRHPWWQCSGRPGGVAGRSRRRRSTCRAHTRKALLREDRLQLPAQVFQQASIHRFPGNVRGQLAAGAGGGPSDGRTTPNNHTQTVNGGRRLLLTEYLSASDAGLKARAALMSDQGEG